MNSRFTFLDQLETDLRHAAEREQHWSGQQLASARTSPERWRPGWFAIAAAFVALLVVAGAIGVLSQPRRDNGSAASFSSVGGAVSGSGDEPAAAASGMVRAGIESGARGNLAQAQPAPAGADVSYDAVKTLNAGLGASGGGKTIPQQDLSKIIRDGTITVVVPQDGFGDAFDEATGIAEAAGGFVLSSAISQENQGTLTIRIPSQKLDGAVVKLRALGRLAELTLTGKDVTASYIDLKSRLGVLKTQRELIVRLLKASTTVSGQLSLSNRFSEVQTQIEQIQGQLNVLNDKVDLATLKVTLREEGVAAPADADQIRNPSLGSAWDRAVQGFLGVIAAVVVGLGYLLPILVIAGIVLGLRLLLRRRRATS
ncbi:MAG: DUF4349 domain-containing protein [Actinomycetota bacterium]